MTQQSSAGTGARAGRKEWIRLAVLALPTLLPAPLSAALVDAAHAAFTVGLNTVASGGASIFVALAILAAAALRRSGEGAAVPVAAA